VLIRQKSPVTLHSFEGESPFFKDWHHLQQNQFHMKLKFIHSTKAWLNVNH